MWLVSVLSEMWWFLLLSIGSLKVGVGPLTSGDGSPDGLWLTLVQSRVLSVSRKVSGRKQCYTA